MSKALQHRLEYGGVYLVSRVARLAPRPVARCMGAALGWCAGVIFRVRRRVVDENLAIAFADKSKRERNRIARGTYLHLGRMAADVLHFLGRPIEAAQSLIASVEGMDALKELLAREPYSVVLCSGHLGSWEFIPAVLTHLKFPTCMVVKPIHNPFIEEMFRVHRKNWGQVVRTDDSMKKIVRLIKEKWMIGLVADQDARKTGIFVDFFGKPASTATGPAFFSIRFGLPLVPIYGFYDPTGRVKVVAEPPLMPRQDLSQEEAIKELTQRCAGNLEARIRKMPEQYWWFHRRWKTAPPAPAKSEAER